MSTNFDQQSLNALNDQINQESISDDENLHGLSIAPPDSMSQCDSLVMFQNETTFSLPTEENSNNAYSKQGNIISRSDKFSSPIQYEDEPHAPEDKESRSAPTKRKRKQKQGSSSSITTHKNSRRLTSKRLRIE